MYKLVTVLLCSDKNNDLENVIPEFLIYFKRLPEFK